LLLLLLGIIGIVPSYLLLKISDICAALFFRIEVNLSSLTIARERKKKFRIRNAFGSLFKMDLKLLGIVRAIDIELQ
jgi:hypothetical protein